MNKMKAPAVVLTNPKYKHNVGGAIRACSCYAVPSLIWTGDRVVVSEELGERLPREERMKGYKDVTWTRSDRPFDLLPSDVVPIGIELMKSSMPIVYFEHPENAIYLFGPEDGSLGQVWRRYCHQLICIPTHHCLNLATAIGTVLYDRKSKRQLAGLDPVLPIEEMLHEHRGFCETPAMDVLGWDGK